MRTKTLIVGLCFAGSVLSLFLVSGCGKKKARRRPPIKRPASSALPAKAPSTYAKTAAPSAPAPQGSPRVLYSFERDTQYWIIPDWATETENHVARSVESSKDFASDGSSSLKVVASFPGKMWTAAVVEVEEYLDWTPYRKASCDIYLPKGAPEGLKAKIILTVGENWRFTEMSRVIFLIPGRWTTVSASLEPGSNDWKMASLDDSFRKDVRKIVVRIESNKVPVYSGPIYIDNFRVE